MAQVFIEIDTSDYDIKMPQLARGLLNLPRIIMEEGSAIVEEELRAVIPVKTGNLRNSVTRLSVQENEAEVGTTAGYGLFVDQPTRPHEIVGNPFLRFEIGGMVLFRRRVFHPGTKGQFIKQRAVQNAAPKLEELIEKVYKQETGSI